MKLYLAMTSGLKREVIALGTTADKAELALVRGFNRHCLGKFSDVKMVGDYYCGDVKAIEVDGAAILGEKH